MYLFGDGDQVGRLIGAHVDRGDMAAAAYASRSVIVAIGIIAARLRAAGATVYYAGGDDIAAQIDNSESLQDLLLETSLLFLSLTGTTFSWGEGETPAKAREKMSIAKLKR